MNMLAAQNQAALQAAQDPMGPAGMQGELTNLMISPGAAFRLLQ
jgi:hypothetical protein